VKKNKTAGPGKGSAVDPNARSEGSTSETRTACHVFLRSITELGACPLCESIEIAPKGSVRITVGDDRITICQRGSRWKWSLFRAGVEIASTHERVPSREAALDAARDYLSVLP
jgi:hypothetical protein